VTDYTPPPPVEGNTYRVIAPLVMCETTPAASGVAWSYVVYRNGPLPANATAACVARLLARGLIVAGACKGGLQP